MTDKTEKLKMKFKNFEDFIQQVHCSEFVGLKYNILEDYEDWICDLDVDDWLRYGDLYAKNICHTDNATPDIDSMLKEFDEVYIGSSAQRIKQWLRGKLGGGV